MTRLRAEASGAATIDEPSPAPEPIDGPSQRIRDAAAMAVFGIGSAICVRARVSKLTVEEVAPIADALAELAHLYGFSLDPRTEGWLALGGALSKAAVPRLMEYKPAPPERPEELRPEERASAPPPPKPEPPPSTDPEAAKAMKSFTSAAP